jgi:peroxin-14
MDSNSNANPPPPSQDAAGGDGEKALAFDAPPQPQPVREDYVQNAVKFLSHPKVRGSAVVYRRSFLQNKGLTSDEIDEAFRRVPDPQPTAASPSAQTQHPPPPAAAAPLQTYAAQPQSAIVVSQQHPRFTWYRAFVAAGLLLGFGASAAVFIKKLFLPRLKSWIRKVVAEAHETAELKSKIDEETKEAVRASSEAVSAIAKTNQELLASKDEGFTVHRFFTIPSLPPCRNSPSSSFHYRFSLRFRILLICILSYVLF